MKEKYKIAHMKAAHVYAELSYCKRKQVGCVIVKGDRIISIGYNGTPEGWDNTCEDKDGTTLPEVLHAELNAIGKLAEDDGGGRNASLFVTISPCLPCAVLIKRAGIKEVYYYEEYRTSEGIEFLRKCGILVEQVIYEK